MFHHNADNESAEFDDRSDNKGPEPEALTIGTVGDRTYAFIGAERVGGIFVYDVTDPANSSFVTYVNNRDFSTDESAAAGDLGPEGFAFVDKADSPNGEYLLIVGNEVSGTTTVYSVKDLLAGDKDDEEKPDENPDENPGDDSQDQDGQNKDGQSSRPSTAAIIAGSVIGVVAALAAAVGLLRAPGIRETVLSLAPAPLREQLEKFL